MATEVPVLATGFHRALGSKTLLPRASIINPDTGDYIWEGRVKSYNEGKGFGFISCPTSQRLYKRDVFLHKDQASGLKVGDAVSFKVQLNGMKQPQAREVAHAVPVEPPEMPQEIADAWAKAEVDDAWRAVEAEQTRQPVAGAEQVSEGDSWAEVRKQDPIQVEPEIDPWEAAKEGVQASDAQVEATDDDQAKKAAYCGVDVLFVKSVDEARRQKRELERLLLNPGAMDPQDISKQSARLAKYTEMVSMFEELEATVDAIGEAKELVSAGGEMAKMAADEIAQLVQRRSELLESFQIAMLPTDARDEASSAILEIRPAAGGDEAALWAEDLMAMYTRYCESEGMTVSVLSKTGREGGGVVDVSLSIKGDHVWSKLKFEAGTHRVQRVPATEAGGRVHTSTATVAIMPEIDTRDGDELITFKESDIEFQFVRAGGKGGQNVNKVATACHATHGPSGTHVFCREERSQLLNKMQAIKYIKAKLVNAALEKRDKAYSDLRTEQIGTGDRSEKIRSYNYKENRVSEHRLNRNFPLEQFMEGKIQPAVELLRLEDTRKKLKALEKQMASR